MATSKKTSHLITFGFEGKPHPVTFVETMDVTTGVKCDVYKFVGDETKDLGIIRIDAGCKTPLQKVLKGERTIEGFVSGKGKLTITKVSGGKVTYEVNNSSRSFLVAVRIGELMQWEADVHSDLVAYEICYPPYVDGRYENIK